MLVSVFYIGVYYFRKSDIIYLLHNEGWTWYQWKCQSKKSYSECKWYAPWNNESQPCSLYSVHLSIENFMSSKKSDWVAPINQTVAWDKLLCQWSEF